MTGGVRAAVGARRDVMAGPLVFWPNRKSKLGLQQSSKVPRTHRYNWFTTPPTMKNTELKLLRQARNSIDAVDDPEFRDSFITDVDRKLPEYAGILRHLFTLLDGRAKAVREGRELVQDAEKWLEESRAMADRCKVIAKENLDLRVENEAKTADLRRLRAEIDPDEIRLKIMYAVDKATADRDEQLRTARAEIVDLRSRIDELERSKRKLRDALARLSEKI